MKKVFVFVMTIVMMVNIIGIRAEAIETVSNDETFVVHTFVEECELVRSYDGRIYSDVPCVTAIHQYWGYAAKVPDNFDWYYNAEDYVYPVEYWYHEQIVGFGEDNFLRITTIMERV